MVKTIKKIIAIVLCFLTCSLTLFGYANVTDNLFVIGDASVAYPEYDEVVIMEISTVSNNATYEDTSLVGATNLKSELAGRAGQKIVLQLKAHNFSQTKSFIFAGTLYDSNVYRDINKLTISVSKDAQNSQPMFNNAQSNVCEGTPVAPGEDVVFYVTYTLTEDISNGEIMVNYKFKQVMYTVTYLNDNEVFAVEHITNNSVAYTVMSQHPDNSTLKFAGWINAAAVVVSSIPAGNTNNYMLSASWENVYLIIFVDADGTILYEEQFTDSSTKLSNEGQAKVDQILAQLDANIEDEHTSVSWSEYDIKTMKHDIVVKPVYNYEGSLNLVPIDVEPKDGIVDYYQVKAVDSLDSKVVVVPGYIAGVPVKVIERITNEDGDADWDNFEESVETIVINEGVEILEHNSLAWTPNLSTVYLPSTITQMGKNTFSRNILLGGFGRGDDKKELVIEYNGTMAQWQAVIANSDKNWDGGLKKGSRVNCIDGYFQLEGTIATWKSKSY